MPGRAGYCARPRTDYLIQLPTLAMLPSALIIGNCKIILIESGITDSNHKIWIISLRMFFSPVNFQGKCTFIVAKLRLQAGLRQHVPNTWIQLKSSLGKFQGLLSITFQLFKGNFRLQNILTFAGNSFSETISFSIAGISPSSRSSRSRTTRAGMKCSSCCMAFTSVSLTFSLSPLPA